MPRRPIIRTNQHYYHLTGRTNNKEAFPLPINEVWEITIYELKKLQLEFDLQISAFVLMSNHFHLLALTPSEDIDRIMYFFMKNVTLRIQKRSGRVNRIFGGRYKGSVIETESYFYNVYKYIYRNPVAAGLTERAQDYEFSTLSFDFKSLKLETPFQMNGLLDFINESFSEVESASIQQGLKKTVFAYPKFKSTGRPVIPQHFPTML